MVEKRRRFLLGLEKLRAGLGAAGMSAVAADLVLTSNAARAWLAATFAFAPIWSIVLLISLVGFAIAAYFADVSEREAMLDREARKESLAPYV